MRPQDFKTDVRYHLGQISDTLSIIRGTGHRGKPLGVWCGYGSNWATFLALNSASNTYGRKVFMESRLYEITLRPVSDILVIDGPAAADELYAEFPDEDGGVDWFEVAKFVDGVDFPLWTKEATARGLSRQEWYERLDIESTCVWNASSMIVNRVLDWDAQEFLQCAMEQAAKAAIQQSSFERLWEVPFTAPRPRTPTRTSVSSISNRCSQLSEW